MVKTAQFMATSNCSCSVTYAHTSAIFQVSVAIFRMFTIFDHLQYQKFCKILNIS